MSKKLKICTAIICLLIIVAAILKINSSIPKELEKLTSPDEKITVIISEKSGNLIIESNRTNPLTIDYENNIEYGMSAFSSDSRYLFVAIEKAGRGDVECRDFVENKSFMIHLQNLIRTSDEFKDFADDNDIEEITETSLSVLDIDYNSIATVAFSFRDQDNELCMPWIMVDLYNQKVEGVK